MRRVRTTCAYARRRPIDAAFGSQIQSAYHTSLGHEREHSVSRNKSLNDMQVSGVSSVGCPLRLLDRYIDVAMSDFRAFDA